MTLRAFQILATESGKRTLYSLSVPCAPGPGSHETAVRFCSNSLIDPEVQNG